MNTIIFNRIVPAKPSADASPSPKDKKVTIKPAGIFGRLFHAVASLGKHLITTAAVWQTDDCWSDPQGYVHWNYYEEKPKQPHTKYWRKRMLLAAVLAMVVMLTAGGAAAQGGTAQAVLTSEDFNIYYEGTLLLPITEALNGTFWFSYADSYNLEPDTLETARGIALGTADSKVLQAYGELTARVDYQIGYVTNTLPQVGYEIWAQSAQYTGNYTVTFVQYTVNGWQQTQEQMQQQLNSGTSAEIVEYGITFLVENSVVKDIECYFFALPV